jgi:hypothetical protein
VTLFGGCYDPVKKRILTHALPSLSSSYYLEFPPTIASGSTKNSL